MVSPTLAINEYVTELRRQGRAIFHLGFGQSPFPVPEVLVQALSRHASRRAYLPVQGLPALRGAVAGYLSWRFGIQSHEARVLIGPGSKMLIYLVQQVHEGPLILPRPSWVSYAPQARLLGKEVLWVPCDREDDWRLNPDRLDFWLSRQAVRHGLLVVNSPNNPTGTTFASNEVEYLAAVARKHGLLVLSDEIYAELTFRGDHRSPAVYYPEGTLVCGGLSKWVGAGGWRLGTLLVPEGKEAMLRQLCMVASETYSCASAPVQYAALKAYRGNAEITTYVHKVRRILERVAMYVYTRLKQAHLHASYPQGGFYLWVDFQSFASRFATRGIQTDVDLCRYLLEDYGVALLPGSAFGQPPEDLTARLAYVDFDGTRALELEESYREVSDAAFCETIAPNVYHALEKLADACLSV